MEPILLRLDTRINNYASIDLMQGYNYTLEAHITDNYKDVDLTGVTVQLQMQKPDKKFIIQTENIIIEGNKIKATLDKDFTREDGQAKLQVVLFKDNFTFGSWVIKAKIKPSAINDNDGQSENKVTITETLINKISEAENTKIELDKSIASGDVATIKGNVDKIKDVEIPKINEQLETIKNNYIYFDLIKGENVKDKFDYIFNNYAGGTVLINKDITLTETINIPSNFSLLTENNSKIISGDFDGVKFNEILSSETTVVSYNDKQFTVMNPNGFKGGDTVKISATINGVYSLVTKIDKVDGNILYIDTRKFELLGSNLSIKKITPNNSFIKGFTFEKALQTSKKDIKLSGCCNISIVENKFEQCSGLTLEGAINCKIKNNNFSDTGDTIFMYDCDDIFINNNTFNNFEHAIRGAYISDCYFTNNIVTNGKNKNYSVGIEVSGVTLDSFKCCYNVIKNNKVVNCNIGVVGSANGGIHLNFNAHHNIIDCNIVLENGIGIYLENYCSNNTMINNISSYNKGYYGVGIELDWNCHNNKIIGNTCEYNNGSVEAGESCGIEVRCGKSDLTHMINNTIVSNNVCKNNGKFGIFLSGKNAICCNNICENNGTDLTHGNERSELFVTESIYPKISNNSVIVGANYGLLIKESDSISITDNNVVSNGQDLNGVFIENVNNCFIKNNTFDLNSRERRVNICASKNVYVDTNVITGENNGYSQLELNGVNGYLIKYNIFSNNTKIVEWECLNKIE